MSKKMIIILLLTIIVVIGMILGLGLSPFSKGEWEGVAEKTQISINDRVLEVYIADTESDRIQGLSGITLDEFDANGMLFEFDDKAERYFWMKDMNFNLDIIWIVNDQIIKIETDINPIDEQGNITHMDSRPYAVDKVMELPAGGVDKYQIEVGQIIK